MKSDCDRENSGSEWPRTPSCLKGHVDPQAAALAIMKTASLWSCVFGEGRAWSASGGFSDV